MSPKKVAARRPRSATRRGKAFSRPRVAAIVPLLLKWFGGNARDLPWRRTQDPYAIWVSEIMLQQTQVKTVIPYWERWMRALPTVSSLANAKPDTIHKLWEGLGYYTRVRNLQKAAQQIVERHDGKFPRDFEAVLDLPGIGRYTAGAICSIAFNQAKPILDGNVIRVLTRLFGIAGNVREKSVNAKLWELAGELVMTAAAQGTRTTTNCSHFNQSLMELGALVCTPKQPKCRLCPLRQDCVAYRTDRVEQLPNLGPRTATTQRRFVAFVVEHRGRYFVRQRPAGVVNAHLWEFPNVEVNGEHSNPSTLAELELGQAPIDLKRFCTIRHSITRYRITLEGYRGRVKSRLPGNPARGAWLRAIELDARAFTSAHRKLMRQLPRAEG